MAATAAHHVCYLNAHKQISRGDSMQPLCCPVNAVIWASPICEEDSTVKMQRSAAIGQDVSAMQLYTTSVWQHQIASRQHNSRS